MNTHKIKTYCDWDGVAITFCGIKVRVTDDNYKRYLDKKEDCTCNRCNKIYNKYIEEQLAEMLYFLSELSRYGA